MIITVALVPELIVPSAHVKLGVPMHVPWDGVTVPRVKPAGHVSESDTPVAVPGPALLTVIVYVRTTPSPAVTVVTLSVLVTERSAWLATVVVAVAELFPVMLSLGDVTVAVFVNVPGVGGAVTTIVKAAAAPAAMDPRVHVTVSVPLQVHPDPLAETNVVPSGMVSVTLTDVAATVAELLLTVMV